MYIYIGSYRHIIVYISLNCNVEIKFSSNDVPDFKLCYVETSQELCLPHEYPERMTSEQVNKETTQKFWSMQITGTWVNEWYSISTLFQKMSTRVKKTPPLPSSPEKAPLTAISGFVAKVGPTMLACSSVYTWSKLSTQIVAQLLLKNIE